MGGRFESEGTRVTYGQFLLMCGRNHNDIVKQLFSNVKK